ncbi:hypothetical protein ACFOLD_05190 [Kocuria carniphila]|uniref:hypothetical protein n=1 Tax=Kocuria carniphila TaxID=262208 RepID=UPI003620043C
MALYVLTLPVRAALSVLAVNLVLALRPPAEEALNVAMGYTVLLWESTLRSLRL